MTEITQACSMCGGDGEMSIPTHPQGGGGTYPCQRCGGVGVIADRNIDLSDFMDKLDDILNKCNDIFEELRSS